MIITKEQLTEGLEVMRHPVIPLARLAQLLYLAVPFETVSELLAELAEPLETNGINYKMPGHFLLPFLTPLRLMESLKNPQPPIGPIEHMIDVTTKSDTLSSRHNDNILKTCSQKSTKNVPDTFNFRIHRGLGSQGQAGKPFGFSGMSLESVRAGATLDYALQHDDRVTVFYHGDAEGAAVALATR